MTAIAVKFESTDKFEAEFVVLSCRLWQLDHLLTDMQGKQSTVLEQAHDDMYDEDDQLSQQTAQAAADARKARDAGREAVGDWLGKMPAVSALGVELTTEQIQLWLNEWLVSHNALQVKQFCSARA